MEILNEKQQIRNRINQLHDIISWQEIKVKQAKRKWQIKTEWIFSFWIGKSSDLCYKVYTWEKNNLEALKEYEKLLTEKL